MKHPVNPFERRHTRLPADRDSRRAPLGIGWFGLGRRRDERPGHRAEGSRRRRPAGTSPNPPAAGRPGGASRPGAPASSATSDEAYDRLVALYTEASTLRDCALVEVRVGEDALSYGDELRASQHFGYSRHYRRRADEADASIRRELGRLRHERADWERVAASASMRARQRLYGSPALAARPQFD